MRDTRLDSVTEILKSEDDISDEDEILEISSKINNNQTQAVQPTSNPIIEGTILSLLVVLDVQVEVMMQPFCYMCIWQYLITLQPGVSSVLQRNNMKSELSSFETREYNSAIILL